MRANQRLKKLEQASGGGFFVGIPEKREGHEATSSGVTHAPFRGVTIARADYETDDDFWAALETRKNALGLKTAIWLPSDPRLL